jgi:hypothetical protein
VYVGGAFITAGDMSASHIAQWDGSNWHALGSGLNDTPLDIAVNGSEVYVGGAFTTAGGASANHIARWDGSRWWALGSGANSFVIAIAVNGNDVYVGGYFNITGGKPSSYFGIWHAGSTAPPVGNIGGQVTGPGGSAVGGALVQVCPAAGGWCPWRGRTDPTGFYTAGRLRAGEYRVKVYAPASASLRPDSTGPITLPENGSLDGQDIHLRDYQPLPSGANLTPSQIGSLQVPRVSWGRPVTLSAQGCSGGSASYRITQGGAILRSGALIEKPAGRYQAAIASLTPYHGNAEVRVTIQCPGSLAPTTDTTFDFDLYIEPDYTVWTLGGQPLAGATVTLYAFDAETGSFLPVSPGDAIMAPVNQSNPDTTDASGSFGWDLSEGFYKIRAEMAGCVAPHNPAQSYVETDVLIVPAAIVADLDLFLDCDMNNVQIHLPSLQR